MSSTNVQSVDRPRFFAIVVSALAKTAFALTEIESFTTTKSDDGSAGTWSLSMPLVTRYLSQFGGGINPAYFNSPHRGSAYASVAAPMDLVAIYATRTSIGEKAIPQGSPVLLDLRTLAYGDAARRTVDLLAARPGCLMIGMVDSAHSSIQYDSGQASFTLSGRDLTKIFEENYVGIPDGGLSSENGLPAESSPGILGLQLVSLQGITSAATFLVDLLDLLVSKDLAAAASLAGTPDAIPSADVVADYKGFGYDWRRFVGTDRLDAAYQHIEPGAYPSYSPQAGPVWGSVQELANLPSSRLFVDEVGQIVFDDSLSAWTTTTIQGEIFRDAIRAFETTVDDHDLITYLSIKPRILTGTNAEVVALKGEYAPASGFVRGVAQASTAGEALVSVYGYRYASFSSDYDTSYPAARLKQAVLLQSHNNLFSGTLRVKGDASYRVGTRYHVVTTTERAETSNAVWYVQQVEHAGNFGGDFTTTLHLRYPQTGNFGLVSGAPTLSGAPSDRGSGGASA